MVLVKTTPLEINGNNNIGDGVEDELNVLGISGTGQVAVDLLGARLVLGDELGLNVLGGGVEFVRAGVVRKADLERAALDLLLEEVLLVEEEYDGRVDEPLVVADRVEEAQRLVHAVRRLVFVEHLVVFAQRHAEDYCCHVFEAVDPLLPL